MRRRSVLFAIGSRANFASCKAVIKACERAGIDVIVLAYASAVLARYGNVAETIASAHETIRVATLVEGGRPEDMVATCAETMRMVPDVLRRVRPDVVYVVGDRYEQLPVAYAAALTNTVVAHQMGGELSGTIDESIRHAITKLSHIHLAATESAARRIRAMGEDNVYCTGCPRLDLAKKHLGAPRGRDVIVLQHPVTSEWGDSGQQMRATLEAVEQCRGDRTVHLFWPNADAGNEAMVDAVRHDSSSYITHRNMEPEKFLSLLARCAAVVGNSSAAIREGAYLGTPAVNVGSRQSWRERGENVLDAEPNATAISGQLKVQLRVSEYSQCPTSKLYGDGSSGERIAKVLASELPPAQKHWVIS